MYTPVIAIFDVGKTNKKVLLFDEQYNVIHEESAQLKETKDEDGFPCEDIYALTNWVEQKFTEIVLRKDIDVKAVNFSAYGASFVYIDRNKKVIAPLYNYLKPFPEKLKQQFYNTYGGENLIAEETASPVLGSLNSGLQLYRLKYEKPKLYKQIKYSLHLPQYLSFIFSSKATSDITSIGCHTMLWNFIKTKYHNWVCKEKFDKKLAPVYNSNKTIKINKRNKAIAVGIGLHDSSAALIPYLTAFNEPFVLLSTGTWCVSLNPFNHTLLTEKELKQDCLCYLSYDGKPVKASRLFAGYEHELQVKRLAMHFNTSNDYYKTITYNAAIVRTLHHTNTFQSTNDKAAAGKQSLFETHDLSSFETFEIAYHQLIFDIVQQQINSTHIILKNTLVKRIFVDGGFSKNSVYMNLLAAAFPEIEVYAANIPQASAFGAALAIHKSWNKNQLPNNLINLKHFKAATVK